MLTLGIDLEKGPIRCITFHLCTYTDLFSYNCKLYISALFYLRESVLSCKKISILETNSVFYRNNQPVLTLALPCNLDFRTIICSFLWDISLLSGNTCWNYFYSFMGYRKNKSSKMELYRYK